MKLVIATKNQGKLKEFQRILGPIGIEILSAAEAGVDMDVEETGATFKENAFLKADAVCKSCGMPALADDSGLCVDALGGAPGVYSARYAGEDADDGKILQNCFPHCRMFQKKNGRRISAAISVRYFRTGAVWMQRDSVLAKLVMLDREPADLVMIRCFW